MIVQFEFPTTRSTLHLPSPSVPQRGEQDRAATQIQAGCRGRMGRNCYKRKRKVCLPVPEAQAKCYPYHAHATPPMSITNPITFGGVRPKLLELDRSQTDTGRDRRYIPPGWEGGGLFRSVWLASGWVSVRHRGTHLPHPGQKWPFFDAKLTQSRSQWVHERSHAVH